MKKIIAISFFFIFLYANTEVGQLLKRPNLIGNFTEHHDHVDEHNISFLDFVKSHYSDNHKHSDADKHDKHQNLPFKAINTNINIILLKINQPCHSENQSILL